MTLIKFKKDIYDELIKQEIFESCGFVIGVDNYFYKIVKAKNREKRYGKFKVGLFDKVKVGFKILFGGFNSYALYHVHKDNVTMSKCDIENASVGSYNIIIAKRRFALYKIIKSGKEKKAISVLYERVSYYEPNK